MSHSSSSDGELRTIVLGSFVGAVLVLLIIVLVIGHLENHRMTVYDPREERRTLGEEQSRLWEEEGLKREKTPLLVSSTLL
jgi:hypothetical protein